MTTLRVVAASRARLRPLLPLAAMVAGCLVLGRLPLHGGPVLCPWRRITGLPCPLCGGTTAAASLGRADLTGALAANPVAVLWGAALGVAPLLKPHGARRLPYRLATWGPWAALAVSELVQLHRLHVLG